MKEIKAFLRNQRDIAMTMWANELDKGSDCNMYLLAHWNNRVVVLDQLLTEMTKVNEA